MLIEVIATAITIIAVGIGMGGLARVILYTKTEHLYG